MSVALTVQEPSAKYLVQTDAHQQAPLVRHFDVIAQAPGGVARLRELILTLAVQGKLLPQDPNDEPARVLLKKIRTEKDRLIAEGKIRRDKPLAEIADEEQPFGLPRGWEWVSLGDLVNASEAGWSPTCIGSPRRIGHWGVLKVSAVSWGAFDANANKELPADLAPRPQYEVQDGDFLLSRANTEELVARSVVVGKAEPKLMLSDKIIRLDVSSHMSRLFLNLCNNAGHSRVHYAINASGTSSSMKNVSREVVLRTPVPVPPLAEQSRIVTRVEELMRLCDALEAKGRLETAQHTQLVNTLLGTLTESETPEQLADNWQRIAAHFDLLLDRPQAVDALEQTILQLAVRGLLVPQDPQDEPASALLKKVRLEKERLIAEGKIKRDKPLPPIAEDEQPFALPKGWSWTRFPDMCVISGGATPSKANQQNWVGTIPWVSPKDMKVPRILDAQDHVSDAAIRGSLSLIPSGSLLMVVRGMILAHSFPIAETLTPVTINQDMKALTPLDPSVLPYLTLLCRGLKPEILALIDRSTHGTCKLESPKIFGKLLPFPPLAEQSRIVTRVTELRALCANLRTRLIASQSTQAHLAEALIGEAVAA